MPAVPRNQAYAAAPGTMVTLPVMVLVLPVVVVLPAALFWAAPPPKVSVVPSMLVRVTWPWIWVGNSGPAQVPPKIPCRRAPTGSCGRALPGPAGGLGTYWRIWPASPWGRFALDARGMIPF